MMLLGNSEIERAALALRTLSFDQILFPVLCQLVVILLTARAFYLLFRKLGQPGVVGEVAAGLVLGPSVFGLLFPQLFSAIFNPSAPNVDPLIFQTAVSWIFQVLAQLGLIFLLFLLGLEFDFAQLHRRGTAATVISLAGMIVPFAFGLALAWLVHPLIEPHPDAPGAAVNQVGFALFMGTALAITAIPVLGRIMVELGIERTQLGAISIASATIEDAIGWILLATVTAVVGGGFEFWSTLRMLVATVMFAAAIIVVGKPLLVRWSRWAIRRGGGDLSMNHLAGLLAIIFLSSIISHRIGIFAIFGAFLLGAVLSGEQSFREAVERKLRDFVTVFFLPIFFTYTGLRTDIGSVGSVALWSIAGLVLLLSVLGKLCGCGLAARWAGFRWREAACIGTLMNTRGLMELIVIDAGYRLQVIPKSVYCMLVMMALATTLMTTPLLMRLMRGTELEPFVWRSGFRRKGGLSAMEAANESTRSTELEPVDYPISTS
ncbi:MAG: cation:proton antiporter [Pirellulales bacterium]|nr:cation:proton antiporter [Pirellulales bacterium]